MASLSTDRVTAGSRMGVVAPITLGFLAALFWLAWQAIRFPILALLVMFEPIVSFALSVLALLVALTAFFWKLVDPKPDFPLWTILAASLACVLLLALYHALIRLLSGSTLRIQVPQTPRHWPRGRIEHGTGRR